MTSMQRHSSPRRRLRLAALAALPAVALVGRPAIAAWPVVAPVGMPSQVVLVQAAPDPGLAPFEELNEALAAARSKLEQLSGAADIAALAADLRRQLAAAEEQNQGLRDQLTGIEAARETITRQLDEVESDLEERDGRIEALLEREAELQTAVERSGEEAARLRKQLQAAEQRIRAGEQARELAEARLVEMQEIVESALGEAAEVGRRVAELERAAAERDAEVADLQKRRETADQALADERGAKERLARDLAGAREALDRQKLENAELEKQVASLREAANQARDVARQNLEAVEEKIRLLNRMLAEIDPAAAGSKSEPGAGPASSNGRDPRFAIPPARPASDRPDLSPVRAANATESPALEAAKQAQRERSGRPVTLAEAAAQLPMEKRVQAKSLLADLKAEKGRDGVVLRVPGEELFALGSEAIEATAHDTLAKVAELLDLFEAREVRIIGHTDAMGDAGYNQVLSERRAKLVKEFFVDHYDVPDRRFTISGAGEREPIATNTTRAGRRANRRIEVVIKD